MKKIKLFLILLVLATVNSAFAQEVPSWKTAEMATWKIQYVVNETETGFTIDSIGEINQFKDYYYYDKAGNLISQLTYNVEGNTLRKKMVYTYNKYNKVLSEECSVYEYYKIDYIYDETGLILLKTTKINPRYNTLIETCDFTYENGLLMKETYKKSNGSESKRYEYKYENGVLVSRDCYKDANYDGNLILSEKTTYTFDSAGRKLKESSVRYGHTGEGTDEFEYDRKCYEYDAEGKLIVDSLYFEHLMAPMLVPSAKHIYKYDENHALVKVLEYGGDSDQSNLDRPGNFPMLSFYYVYTPQLYGENRSPKNILISAGSDAGIVKITFEAPTVTEGLEGYKVMVDGEFLDETFTGTEITLAKQKKGEHTYYVFPIYNKELANASDPVTFNVEIDCPPVTDLEVASYEFYSYAWNLTLKWKAPINNKLTFKNYRYLIGTTGGTSVFDMANVSTYSKDAKTVISVYAVYEEGESDPCTIEFDLSDVSKSKIAHWNNSGYVEKDVSGKVLMNTSYFYKAYSDAEQLVSEVRYDAKSNPTRKIEKTTSGITATESQYAWDKENWKWKRDVLITSESNYYYQLITKKTKVLGESGKLVDSAMEVYTYATLDTKDKQPIQTDCWTISGQDTTLVSVKKHSYDSNGKTDMIYNADSTTITGKEEYFYLDPAKVDSVKTYTYDGTNYMPVSKTTIEYLSGTKLVSSEKTYKYANGSWVKDGEKIYTASPAYHKTHVATDFTAVEGDNVITLNWEAPTNAEGLSGYKVYANEVLVNKSLLPASSKSYDVKGLPTGSYNLAVLAVYNTNQDANYVAATEAIAHTDMTTTYANLKAMLAAGVSAKEYGSKVAGEVTVTGVLDPQSYGESYFVADASGAVNVVLSAEEDAPVFEFKAGDKIKNLKGLLKEEDGAHYFVYEAAELVSRNNNVTPTVMTIKDFVESPANVEAQYIKFEKVTFSDEVDPEHNLLPSICHMVQDGATTTLMLGRSQIEKPDAANVSGFVMKMNDGWAVVLNGERSFNAIYNPLEFANLKEMIDAGMDKKYRTYIVKGEALVTGHIRSFIGSKYFVEDATAALCLLTDELSDFSVNVGDKIKDLAGVLNVFDGAHSFAAESATQVNTKNPVNPTVLTIAALNENPATYESRYVKFEEVTFENVGSAAILPAIVTMAQGNNKVTLSLGEEQIAVAELANVSGFVSLGSETQILLNGKEGFENVTGISTVKSVGIYYDNGEVVAEGASKIEIFDMTGCKLVYTENERAVLNGIHSGIIAVKATYANGAVRIVKFVVK